MELSPLSTIERANIELYTKRNLGLIGELFSADYIAHLTDSDLTGGHRAIRRVLEMYHRSFADITVEVEVLVQSTDRVAWQRTLRANHDKAFKGFPATGGPITWREMVTSRFSGGLIAEEWVLSDLAERLLLAKKEGQRKR